MEEDGRKDNSSEINDTLGMAAANNFPLLHMTNSDENSL